MRVSKLMLVVLVLISHPVHSEILWEDDFNGFTAGWVAPTSAGNRFYPWTTDETYDPTNGGDYVKGGGYGAISDYEPSVYAQGARTNLNSWNGYTVGYGAALEINTTSGRGATPGVKFTIIKIQGLSGETGINKWLGNTHHQELYIRYFQKFGDAAGDFKFNGDITGGNPSNGVIWKLGRAWTGFNPIDYDKTGGQTLPAENTSMSDESNWRYGIWIHRLKFADWSDPYTPYFDIANFYADLACTPNTPTCDSQSPSRDPSTGNIMDWAYSAEGQFKTWANSTNNLNTDGAFTESQGWHCIEMYLKNRTSPSIADGAQRVWVDGVELVSPSVSAPVLASMSTDPDDYGINFVRFGDNFNNLTNNISDGATQNYYIDDIVISTTYIGPDYVIGSGVTPMSNNAHISNTGQPMMILSDAQPWLINN